jgi:nucleotide-binding universal stress UspA family protein
MNPTSTPAGAIVVGVDGSGSGSAALAWAAVEADLTKRPLVIVHAFALPTANEVACLASGGVSSELVVREGRKDAAQLLAQAQCEAAKRYPDLHIITLCREEDARVALLELARHAHQVVVGSRGRGPLKSLLLGSVSLAVSRHAVSPVVVVRPSAPEVPRHGVLVGTTVDEASLPTLEAAYQEASLRAVPLTVLHCDWDGDPSTGGWQQVPAGTPAHTQDRLAVAETLAGLVEKYPDVVTKVVLTQGAADRCFVDLAATHELAVVGRHGASFLDFTGLGSMAATVVEHARTTVLVVP